MLSGYHYMAVMKVSEHLHHIFHITILAQSAHRYSYYIFQAYPMENIQLETFHSVTHFGHAKGVYYS